jgi:Histidine kinase-, DNA gyrase B-, and HSP90-like ATPase
LIISARGSARAMGKQAIRPQLVSASNFVLATRDTGYKSTAQAVAEFIDNSLQAGARSVAVEVIAGEDQQYPVELAVTDDGVGMDATTLASALTFGGSSRFGDRSSLGRYGMGLPNGALSRARRVEVFTWQGTRVLASCLDLDEIVVKSQRTLSPIETVRRPAFLPRTPHGTTVRLRRCDRLEYRRVSTIVSKLKEDLGRIYRRFLQGGLDLRVNGQIVVAVDPLFLQKSGRHSGARQFGDDLVYRLPSANGGGKVEVRFSELPVERWHSLTSEEKRGLGVTNAPCVSVVRAGREIDRGWFFMGAKRRENYDDWWRCEISFDPCLDELFGLTHAKQTISPTDELERVLEPDLEPIARALNNRVRQRFEVLKVTSPLSAAERQAARADGALPALPRRPEIIPQELQRLLAGHTFGSEGQENPYQIVVTDLPSTAAFDILVRRGQLVLLLSARHPLYRDLYGPLAASESEKDQGVAKQIALALLAAARAEATTRRTGRSEVRRFRQAWADVVATFFNA